MKIQNFVMLNTMLLVCADNLHQIVSPSVRVHACKVSWTPPLHFKSPISDSIWRGEGGLPPCLGVYKRLEHNEIGRLYKNRMDYGILYPLCLGIYKRRNERESNIIPFTFYLSFLRIVVESIFLLYFIKGMSVPLFFRMNAYEWMGSN